MRGLTVVVADAGRVRIALELAAASAALGGRARVFCQGAAVAAFADPPEDPAYPAAGLPRVTELIEAAFALGVELIACQSGLALTGVAATRLDPRIAFGGLVSLLQTLGEDRLVVT